MPVRSEMWWRRDRPRKESAEDSKEQLAATLEKTQLEVKRLREEVDLSLRKYQLEIEKLSREISLKRRVSEIFLDKWAPALMASIILFTAVPLANDKFWRS